MAATAPLSRMMIAAAEAHRRKRLELIEAGELVPNAPLRERLLWLLDHDPDFSREACCRQLADLGFPAFVSPDRRSGHSDSSRLARTLGIKRQNPTLSQRRHGLPGSITTHIEYDLAVALCRALGMDPYEAGV